MTSNFIDEKSKKSLTDLDYSLDDIKNSKEVCWRRVKNEKGVEEEQLNPVTAMLLMSTELVGINKITEKTINEFLTRLKMMEAIGNVLIIDPEGKVRNHNEHELRLHMNLSTTAHPLDKKKFRNRIANWVEVRAKEIKDLESVSIIKQEENNADKETGNPPKKEDKVRSTTTR
jgi:hypothetical protein